jgi:hypothetical protein
MEHSNVVGGSSAKRVINCPGSVVLVQKMPRQVSSKYAAEGTALHTCIDRLVNDDTLTVPMLLGKTVDGVVITEDHIEKLSYAIQALDTIDPAMTLRYVTEVRVGFGDLLPGVFGSTDLIGKQGRRAVVLDWKFGDGVMVDAEENMQGMFYAAAAMRTPETQWVFDGVDEIEIIIVQPPYTRRWVTTPARIADFEAELVRAVKRSQLPDAPLSVGDHCRWCTAKPICPQMTGAVDRVARTALEGVDSASLATALALADQLETFINDARALAFARLEKGLAVPGYKLVSKRATRQWTSEAKAKAALLALDGVAESDVTETSLLSPAQAEKVLKKRKLALPADVVVAVSSGNTLAAESDPRPPVLLIGQQLTAALSKLV